MRLEFEYPIVTTGTPGGLKNHRTIAFRDRVSVEMPEFASREVPAVLQTNWDPLLPDAIQQLRTINGVEGKLYTATNSRPSTEPLKVKGETFAPGRYRFSKSSKLSMMDLAVVAPFDSRLHAVCKALHDEHGSKIGSHLYPADLAEVAAWEYDFQQKAVDLPFLHDIKVRDLDEIRVETARAEFMKYASAFILVDGLLHRNVLEPAYKTFVRKDAWNVTVETVQPGAAKPLHRNGMHFAATGFFRADHMEEAKEFALQSKSRLAGTAGAPFVDAFKGIKVIDPAYVRFDEERESLLLCAERMAVWTGNRFFGGTDGEGSLTRASARRVLDGMDLDTLILYRRLRAAIDIGDTGNLVEVIGEALAHEGVDGSRTFAPTEWSNTLASMAMERWEARPVSLDFAMASAPRG